MIVGIFYGGRGKLLVYLVIWRVMFVFFVSGLICFINFYFGLVL